MIGFENFENDTQVANEKLDEILDSVPAVQQKGRRIIASSDSIQQKLSCLDEAWQSIDGKVQSLMITYFRKYNAKLLSFMHLSKRLDLELPARIQKDIRDWDAYKEAIKTALEIAKTEKERQFRALDVAVSDLSLYDLQPTQDMVP